MLALFTIAIFVGAALLFLVQPMFARMMLPQLGGSPAVWNTAMVFYQAALLAGYAYAHFAVQKLGACRQSLLHSVLILLPLLTLPIGLGTQVVPPTSTNPIPWILSIMTLAVGLPFFAVSATSPLLQRWFATTNHPAARDPYFLYAASNAGSLLALLAYPLWIEPNFTLRDQSRYWSWGYGVLCMLIFGCVALLWKHNHTENHENQSTLEDNTEVKAEQIPLRRKLRWVLLAFVPSSLMLSVTTYLTTDIASMPLLWIIPLALYLLTFILAFAARPLVAQALVVRAFAILVLPLVIVMATNATLPLLYMVGLHLLVFFLASLACHGALAQDRPAPANLTGFYLLVSLGGVLGGAFNALLAPLIFHNITEYPIVLVAAVALVIPAAKTSDDERLLDVLAPIVLAVLCAALILVLQSRGYTSARWTVGAMFGIPTVLAFAFSRRPLRFALALGLILLASNLRSDKNTQLVHAERSFFGIIRVVRVESKTGLYHRLMHGSTLHGLQSRDPARALEPLTYYTRSGPLGQLIAALEKRTMFRQSARVGAVGLGTGTAACYIRPGQRWTFYEIDPAVKEIAENPEYFSYMRASGSPPVILGDGRLQLQNAPDAQYDLLILDAYSSDALPVHLLTREALQLYLQKLSPDGVMIFNISNRHLDLEPLMAALAAELNLVALERDDFNLTTAQTNAGKTVSKWVALARRKNHFGVLNTNNEWKKPQAREGVRAWTDDYSSLLSVFEWK